MVEEIEEGGTLPAAIAPTIAADQDVTHNHYHLSDRRRHGGRGRKGTSFMREYAALERSRDRDDGVLGLVDRERDRELDRNMVDREVASRRDLRMMAMLDRERERDRGGTDVMGLLERELERKRDPRPQQIGKKSRLKVGSKSEDEGWLRAEIEALRKDFKKLSRAAPVTATGHVSKNNRRDIPGGTSIASRSSGRQGLPGPVDIQFSSTANGPSDNGGGDDDEDDEDDEDGEEGADDDSVSSTRG